MNQRLTCLMGFRHWAQKRGYIDSLPWNASPTFVAGNSQGFMRHAHAAKTTEGDDLRLKVFREPPKLLSLDQAKLLIQACPTRALHLMTVLMLQTGLRNEECRAFPTKYLFDPTGLDVRRRIRIDLSPSDRLLKNSKPRTVFIGWHIVRELFDYLSFGKKRKTVATTQRTFTGKAENQYKTFNASSAKLPWVAWGRLRPASRTRSQ